ncbi:MAG: hypothetical protein H6873_03795 [Hyphomicrobiaceae bacterium]|nr:hypothetical protein [Hyphomicrobiaceae bacterium]
MTWFKPMGLFYRPASLIGWLITFVALAFAVNTFMVADAHSHSVSDTLYAIFPYWLPTLLLWLWIAQRTSTISP